MTAVKVAAVHAALVLADRVATIGRVVSLAGQAARRRATLAVFPEAFVPGYPDWHGAAVPGAPRPPSYGFDRIGGLICGDKPGHAEAGRRDRRSRPRVVVTHAQARELLTAVSAPVPGRSEQTDGLTRRSIDRASPVAVSLAGDRSGRRHGVPDRAAREAATRDASG